MTSFLDDVSWSFTDLAGFLFCAVVVLAFVYYGYRDDYRRNKQGFLKTIVMVPVLALASVLGIAGLMSKKRREKTEEK